MNCLVEQRRKQMICDHIIWTTSLGHLKKHFHEIFAEIPDLIQQKQNAIANLGFGTVNKVFLVYKKKFWSKKASSIVLLHTNRQFQFEMSDQLREQLQNERVDPVVFDEIVRMLFHYDVLPSTDIPVLICWFVGPAAIMMEKLSEQLVGQICHEVVCSFLRISWQKYPLDQVVRFFEHISSKESIAKDIFVVEVHGIVIHTSEDPTHIIQFIRIKMMENNYVQLLHRKV